MRSHRKILSHLPSRYTACDTLLTSTSTPCIWIAGCFRFVTNIACLQPKESNANMILVRIAMDRKSIIRWRAGAQRLFGKHWQAFLRPNAGRRLEATKEEQLCEAKMNSVVARYGMRALRGGGAGSRRTIMSRSAEVYSNLIPDLVQTRRAFNGLPAALDRRRIGFKRFLSARSDTTSFTVANEGVIGSGDPAGNTGPGALKTGYIDDYHNHSHRYRPGDPSKRAFTYMILGTTKFIAASAVRVLILKLIYSMSASADVLAKGSIEVDLSAIPLGTTATLKWRGKPVFIRHRTSDEISLAARDDNLELRDPEADLDRVQKPEWLIVVGVCTHLGCVPIAGAGDYKGWFCPCHGSHYDVSGRTRKGPAPLNLEVPSYRFVEDDTKVILG